MKKSYIISNVVLAVTFAASAMAADWGDVLRRHQEAERGGQVPSRVAICQTGGGGNVPRIYDFKSDSYLPRNSSIILNLARGTCDYPEAGVRYFFQ